MIIHIIFRLVANNILQIATFANLHLCNGYFLTSLKCIPNFLWCIWSNRNCLLLFEYISTYVVLFVWKDSLESIVWHFKYWLWHQNTSFDIHNCNKMFISHILVITKKQSSKFRVLGFCVIFDVEWIVIIHNTMRLCFQW